MPSRKLMQLRLPADLKTWVQKQANANASSQNSEIIRAVRQRKELLAHETISEEGKNAGS